MTTKDKVLAILEKNKGNHISGSKIAKELDISRNSIWKAIKSLQDEGHKISAITNKGYSLDLQNTLLSSQSISKHLESGEFDIRTYKTVDSTNTILKLEAEAGAPAGTIIISEEQTKGRGRMGRTFYSPENTGIYMSILLRPKISAHESLSITTCAAVAVAEAIEINSNKKAKIKWVNDVFLDNKKVCGILTEASLDLENAGLRYAILGIGINVFSPRKGFPNDISNTSTSIFQDEDYSGERRSKLIADVINIFFNYYEHIQEKPFLEEYKKRSLIIGKEINIIRNKNIIEKAIALDIDNSFRLKVKKENGEIEYLNSGEVSIRKS